MKNLGKLGLGVLVASLLGGCGLQKDKDGGIVINPYTLQSVEVPAEPIVKALNGKIYDYNGDGRVDRLSLQGRSIDANDGINITFKNTYRRDFINEQSPEFAEFANEMTTEQEKELDERLKYELSKEK